MVLLPHLFTIFHAAAPTLKTRVAQVLLKRHVNVFDVCFSIGFLTATSPWLFTILA